MLCVGHEALSAPHEHEYQGLLLTLNGLLIGTLRRGTVAESSHTLVGRVFADVQKHKTISNSDT